MSLELQYLLKTTCKTQKLSWRVVSGSSVLPSLVRGGPAFDPQNSCTCWSFRLVRDAVVHCLCGYMHKHVCARMHIREKAQATGSEVAERCSLVSMEMRVPRALFRTEGYFSKLWALGCHMGNFSFDQYAPFTDSLSGVLGSRCCCSSRLAYLDSCSFFLPGSVPTSSYPRHAPE